MPPYVYTSRFVLIVDDDPIFCDIIKQKLIDNNISCKTCLNGKEAIDFLNIQKSNNASVDLIISDLEMPIIDGFGLIKTCRKDKYWQRTPIIVVTGAEQSEIVEKAFQVGATNFLTKPINFTMFIQSVNFILRSSSIEQELWKTTKQLEKSNNYKNQLISVMNHELKTPLNFVIGFGEMLQESVHDKKQKEYANYVINGGKKLLSALSDVLFLSNARSEEIKLYPSKFPLQYLIEELKKTFSKQLKEKSITLTINTLINEEIDIVLDKEKTLIALEKILDNAIKFSPKNSDVKLVIDQCKEFLIFLIIDNGSGIDQNILSKLGQEFIQEDLSLSRKNEGMGLGVAVAMHIAKSHQGSVKFSRSNIGETVVCIMLKQQNFVTYENHKLQKNM